MKYEFITENITEINSLYINKKGNLYVNCLQTNVKDLLNYIKELQNKINN